MANQNTCPVCMTRMRLHQDGHTKVCPECGYKLCDHTYMDRELFDTDHSHNDYISYTANDNQQIPDPVFPASNLPTTTVPTRTTPVNISAEDYKKKKNLRRIIIGYIIVVIWILISMSME